MKKKEKYCIVTTQPFKMTETNQDFIAVVVFDSFYDHEDEHERKNIQIKRMIAFQKRPRDIYAETRGERLLARTEKIKSGSYYSLPEIFALLKTALENMESNGPKRADLLKKTKNAIDVYTAIPRALDILQKRMPVVLINSYLQISHLRRDISKNMEIFGAPGNVDEKVVRLLENLEEVLYRASEAMLGFWKSMPDVALRLPFEITKDFLSSDVFESDPYRRYTISSMLPYWVDPRIMAMINEARKNMFQIPPLPIMTATELLSQQLREGTAKCEEGPGEGLGLAYYTLYV